MRKQKTIPALADIPAPETSRYEWQVISDIISQNDTMQAVAEIVDEGHFTDGYRKSVWNACLRRFNSGEPFDMAAVSIDCGPQFVQHMYSTEVDDLGSRYAAEHARILHTAIMRRRCFQASLEMLALSQDETSTDASIYSRASDIVGNLEPTTVKREVPLNEILNNIADEIERRAADEKEGRPNRVTSGMAALDDVLYGGWAPGNLVILSARPSVGKTALMLHMAKAAAASGTATAVFSIEMTNEELGTRMIAGISEEYDDEEYKGMDRPRRSRISPYKLARGFDSAEDWTVFESVLRELDYLPIVVNDSARDIRDIIARITVLNKQGKCGIAFIDYLGLIAQAQADSRIPLYQQLAQVTGALKATAKNLHIPIVLLCQLNREAAKTNRTPQLYNLRDSGAIEQDADVVLMLDQTEGPRLPDLEVWVRKNRQGEKDFGILMRPSDNYMDFKEQCILKNK